MDPGASAKFLPSAVKVSASLWSRIANRRVERHRRKEAEFLLGFGGLDNCSYRVAMSHPTLHRGSVHADDASAFAALAGPALAWALDSGWLSVETDICTDIEGDLVLVGSPGPESLSRLVFGYRRDVSAPEGLIYVGDTLDLPYRWQEDISKIGSDCLRYQPNGRVTLRPNWSIVHTRGARERTLYPRLRNDGFLETDYLLVSRLPNFLTNRALSEGRTIVSVGGTHGIGTRAVSFVTQSEDFLTRISRYGTSRSLWFQALFEARSIVHNPNLGSRAKSLALVDFVPLRYGDEALGRAQKAVFDRYTAWATEAVDRGLHIPMNDSVDLQAPDPLDPRRLGPPVATT